MRGKSWFAVLFSLGVAWCGSVERLAAVVILENSSAVDWTVLSAAKLTAAEILETGGVKLRWSTKGQKAACDPAVIRLRLEPSSQPEQVPGALGFALPYARGGTTVTVFLDRVRPLLARGQNSPGAILGHVLAHELTHALQRIARHSTEGLMKAAWNEDDFQAMTVRPMQLTSADAALIRTAIGQCSTLAKRPE
jgi:hypothetical protein